jgi:hypothetical protein
MTKTKDPEPDGPVPDGTPQYDDGRCVFCGSTEVHVHAEPRPPKTKKGDG